MRVADESSASLYKDAVRGRPRIPPCRGVLPMRRPDPADGADAAAPMRVRLDLRWKHARGRAVEARGFDATVWGPFRRTLLAHPLERGLVNRRGSAARAAG